MKLPKIDGFEVFYVNLGIYKECLNKRDNAGLTIDSADYSAKLWKVSAPPKKYVTKSADVAEEKERKLRVEKYRNDVETTGKIEYLPR